MRALVLVLLLAGCGSSQRTVTFIGQDHRPYPAKPRYLTPGGDRRTLDRRGDLSHSQEP